MSLARIALVVAAAAAIPRACGDSGTGATARLVPPPPAAILSSTDSVLARAESLFWRSEYDSAAALWTAALADSRDRADRTRETRALTWLGLTTRRQGDLAAARAHLEQALRVTSAAAKPGEVVVIVGAKHVLPLRSSSRTARSRRTSLRAGKREDRSG